MKFADSQWFLRHFDLKRALARHLYKENANSNIMEEKEMENTKEMNTEETINTPATKPQSEETQDELSVLKAELAEQKDKFIRLYADFDNFKRRSSKERLEYMQTAGRDVIQSLLEVMDDCDRAEKQLQNSEDLKQIREGVMLVFNKLRNTLTSKGLKEMKSIGEEFNVDLHEAITEIPVADEKMKGKVVDEVEKGYTLNDKIIRFSKVVVGK